MNLLAWQLELVDATTGRLNLDTTEQSLLLEELANALGQPRPELCDPCQSRGDLCAHPQLSHTPLASSVVVPGHRH